jgi:hypothetical protein
LQISPLKPKNHNANSLSSGADNKIQVIKKEVQKNPSLKVPPIKVKKIESTMLLGKVIDLQEKMNSEL